MPRDHKELVVWQLADELRILVFALTENGQAAHDLKFRGQLRDAVSSVGRNLGRGILSVRSP